MNVGNFTLDAKGATVVQNDERLDGIGNKVIRQKWNNGFTWIRTETNSGFERMDFSHQLQKTPEGSYTPDLSRTKNDFHDYY